MNDRPPFLDRLQLTSSSSLRRNQSAEKETKLKQDKVQEIKKLNQAIQMVQVRRLVLWSLVRSMVCSNVMCEPDDFMSFILLSNDSLKPRLLESFVMTE